jgi:hypothetical protein
VPGIKQQLGRPAHPLDVVGDDRVGPRLRHRAVEGHHRNAQVPQLTDLGPVGLGRRQNDALDPFRRHHLQIRPLLLRLVVGIAQQHPISLTVGGRLDRAHQLGEVRIADIGHHHPDRL